ncbi:MAG: FAD-binding oxidoreductase [Deltaproteobacteria bacterium]
MNAITTPPPSSRASILGVPALEAYEPESVAACAELFTRAAERKLRLGIIGGGTALGVGNAPSTLDAVVFTRRLERVVEYAPEDQVIVVEAGLTLARLQALARQNGQWLGVDAPQASTATLGGLVAVGGFGPRRARYGAIRDLLLGVTLVRADGAIAHGGGKVVKNVAGFDLPKVVAGSLGTLGLIAQVTLRLHPLPELGASFRSLGLDASGVVQAMLALRRAQLEPSSLVALLDAHGRFELGVRLEGFRQGVERDAARLLELPELTGKSSPERLSEALATSYWQRAETPRTACSLRIRIHALPTQLPDVQKWLEPLLTLLEGGRLVWYATLGIGFVAGDPGDPRQVAAALASARGAAMWAGGSLVIDAAPSAVRAEIDAWGPLPSAFSVMSELKQRFDPERRLNPGRFVGGL